MIWCIGLPIDPLGYWNYSILFNVIGFSNVTLSILQYHHIKYCLPLLEPHFSKKCYGLPKASSSIGVHYQKLLDWFTALFKKVLSERTSLTGPLRGKQPSAVPSFNPGQFKLHYGLGLRPNSPGNCLRIYLFNLFLINFIIYSL